KTQHTLHSKDPAFDFETNIFRSIERIAYAAYDSDKEDWSPLTSLSASPASTRPSSPLDTTPQLTNTQPILIMPVASGATASPVSTEAKRKARKRESSHRNRKKKREAAPMYHPNPIRTSKHVQNAKPAHSTLQAEDFPIASTGYIGRRKRNSCRHYELDELVGPASELNFMLIKWDGMVSMPLVDNKQRVVGICAGVPDKDNTWSEVHHHAAELLESARPHLSFNRKDKKHRRGNFSALSVGISHGGGQPYPKTLRQDARNEPILEELMKDKVFERISGFATGAFAEWAPRLYSYQSDYLSRLIAHDQKLRRTNCHPNPKEKELCRNWPWTPWAAATFNFGPQTVCFQHADTGNLAFGWCAITALGNYDHTKGGHLVLWDLGLVIEFPPGSTILIPSSAIHHSNIRIQPGERRYSFTQFSAGGIFRWVDHDFQKVDDYKGSLGPEDVDVDEVRGKLSDQLSFGISLHSTIEELRS
ncbi:hypothetical protein CVT25_003529, partial [Psilocybe cyanescens]